MSMRPSKAIFNLADRVSVVLALFGVVFSGASSEECSLKHAQTHPEQGVLRSLNTRVGPCTNHEHALFSTYRDSLVVRIYLSTWRTILSKKLYFE